MRNNKSCALRILLVIRVQWRDETHNHVQTVSWREWHWQGIMKHNDVHCTLKHGSKCIELNSQI